MNAKGAALGKNLHSPRAGAGVGSLSTLKPQSLCDSAYEAIKHSIITCAYKPGEYINEASVSMALDIGRTPVHQAIGRLMLEGMVDVIPRKGVFVRPVSLDEVMQIIDVRLINESYCVRLAAARADQNEIRRLSEIVASAPRWIKAHDTERLMQLDRDFHGVLARASKNAIVADFLSKLHDRSLRFWFISLNRQGHHESVQSQHESILAAIEGHDPHGAEQAMRMHIEAFRQNLLHSI